MITKSEVLVVTADWLVPVDSAPIPNGFIVIKEGMIRFVGTEIPTEFRSVRVVCLPGFAVLPGLVNSHCHLEFSDLSTPIPTGDSFPDWIRNLLAFRRAKTNNPEDLASSRRAAITSGIRESYRSGVRWIVDMATQPWSADWISEAVESISAASPACFTLKAPVFVQPCIELMDVVNSRIDSMLALANKHIDAPKQAGVGRIGVAPHAPYTASRNVTQWCANLIRSERRLVTMHLAESKEEMQWLKHREGPFAELLGPIIDEGYFERTGQIAEHVELLSKSWRALIAHGNYLSQQDLMILAENAATMGIVHCPRTHQYFGHLHETDPELPLVDRYPLGERTILGVRHFLGTDSRASNPDLNLWTEAKRVRAVQTILDSAQILKMITTDAAEFLDIEDEYGAIRIGQPAALTAIKLGRLIPRNCLMHDPSTLYDAILEEDTVSAPLEWAIANHIESI